MLRRGFAALSFVSVLLLCSAGTLAQVDGGLLPFSARLPDAFYAHQLIDVAEDDGDGGGLRVQSEQRVYYKKPDSPDVSPYYYLGTDHPAWPLRDVPPPAIVYAQPAVPDLPLDLFYTNYEIRVYGVGEAAGRSCFLVSIIKRAMRSADQPVLDLCVDRETGLSLQATAYDRHGKPYYRGTYLAFDTNPDLTGIEFPRLPWEVVEVPSTDLTPGELAQRLPWLRLPTWLPGNFRLLAIQHWHAEWSDGQRRLWSGRESERYDILYTDGLEVIRITALDPIASTYMPGRQDFQAPARDSESSPLLYADGGYIVMAEKMYRIADDDVYRMLWSMLPGGREDEYEATSGIELKPEHQGGPHHAL